MRKWSVVGNSWEGFEGQNADQNMGTMAMLVRFQMEMKILLGFVPKISFYQDLVLKLCGRRR